VNRPYNFYNIKTKMLLSHSYTTELNSSQWVPKNIQLNAHFFFTYFECRLNSGSTKQVINYVSKVKNWSALNYFK
jgi:hypothetical protein